MFISSVSSRKIRDPLTELLPYSVRFCHIWFHIRFKLLTYRSETWYWFSLYHLLPLRFLSGNFYQFEYVTASPDITITSSTVWTNFRVISSSWVMVFSLSVWKCLCRMRVTNYFPQHKLPKCRRVRRVMESTIFRLFCKPAGVPQQYGCLTACFLIQKYSAGINRWGLHRVIVNTHMQIKPS